MAKSLARTILVCAIALAALAPAGAAPRKAMHAVPPVAVPAGERAVVNPPLYTVTPIRPLTAGAPLLALTPSQLLTPGEKKLDMHVVYTIGKLYNPSTARDDAVTLRSYANSANGVAGEYVAPTIPVTPGDTIHIVLHNDLPDDPTCVDMPGMDMNHPHCFNGTNLHSHGLWVSPTGNSDNVLLSIDPHQTFEYIYNIPSDHPAGTFWYHTHRHGSTALQVSSGMAGAIIIRGNRLPTPAKNGDIDTLLQGVPEQVLVMQQIQYACLTPDYTIQVKTVASKVVAWTCNSDQTAIVGPYIGTDGKLGYSDKNGRGYGPSNWFQSDRYTSVNGVVLPTFTAIAGQMSRWRMIHAGVRDTISLQFYHMRPGVEFREIESQGSEAFIKANCLGKPIPYHMIAQDGLTMAQAQQTTLATFQPGYRVDALMLFPQAGDYCIIDASSSAGNNVVREDEAGRLVGKVRVGGSARVADIAGELTRQLVARARFYMPANMKAAVAADIAAGLKFTHFVPHPTIVDAEVTGHQYLDFKIDTASTPTKFEVGSADYPPRPYDPGRIDRYLTLGGVDEWKLQSLFVSHPFHIHVNPFQIVAIYDPAGKNVSEPGAVDNYALDANGNPTTTPNPDPQYPGLKDVWKDTIWVKNINSPGGPNPADPKGMYTIVMRTRYERYIGEFVLHCHILDHEDQGMMQNVDIVPPTYNPPAAAMEGMNH